MRTELTNRAKQSLIEVEVTLHPEALREAFLGRDGLLWRALRVAVLAVAFLLALGTELALPRFFPELPFRPLLLVVAYLSLHVSLGVSLAIACCAGLLLDVGCGMLPGAHLLPFVFIVGVLQTLRSLPMWDALDGWGRAVAAGALANFLMAIYEALFLSIGVPWETWWQTTLLEGLLGTVLTALAAAPALFFCLDCLRTAGTDEALFLPKTQETPDPCTDGTEQ